MRNRSFADRLAALEALEAEQDALAQEEWRPAPEPPPSFDTILAQIELVLAALADGRALVCPGIYGNKPGEPYRVLSYGLAQMSDPEVCEAGLMIEGWRRYNEVELSTAAEYTAWIRLWRSAYIENVIDGLDRVLAALDERRAFLSKVMVSVVGGALVCRDVQFCMFRTDPETGDMYAKLDPETDAWGHLLDTWRRRSEMKHTTDEAYTGWLQQSRAMLYAAYGATDDKS